MHLSLPGATIHAAGDLLLWIDVPRRDLAIAIVSVPGTFSWIFFCVCQTFQLNLCVLISSISGKLSWLPIRHWSLIVVYLYPGGYYVCLDALLIRNTENDEKRSFGNSQTCDNCLSCKSCWGLTEIVAADASVPVIPCFPNIPQAWLLFWQHYKSSVERERNTSEESKAFTYLENWH